MSVNDEKRVGHWLTQWAQLLAVVVAVLVAVVGATFYVVNELARLDQGLADVKAELADVKAGLADMKAELADVKAELADMKAEFADVKAELAGLNGLELRLGRYLDERWETRLETLSTDSRDGRRQIRDEISKVKNSVVSLSERVAVLEAAQES